MQADEPVSAAPESQELAGAKMLAELNRLLASIEFQNSPKLATLLSYMVGVTIDGNGDKLKSYTLAVDALGRSEDFDPQADSYPRVQVTRLRKLLEAQYAHDLSAKTNCLYLQAGSYRIRMARFEVAYPQLNAAYEDKDKDKDSENASRSHYIGFPASPAASANLVNMANEGTSFGLVGKRYRTLVWVAVVLFIVTPIIGALYWATTHGANPYNRPPPTISSGRPVLLLETLQTATDESSRDLADDIYAKLSDGISRSWVVRLRLQPTLSNRELAAPDYRLQGRLSKLRLGKQLIYLRLTNERTGELIWATSTEISDDKPLSKILGYDIAQIASPDGVIMAIETQNMDREVLGGYSCLVGYLESIKTRNNKLQASVQKCLGQPSADPEIDAIRMVLQSFLIVETAQPETRKAQAIRAAVLSRQAIQRAPMEAYGHFSLARIYFATGHCDQGSMHMRNAIVRNPYDPVILAILGNLAVECGDPTGHDIVDAAFANNVSGDSIARLSLVLSAVRDKRQDRLLSLAVADEAVGPGDRPYHYLCEALIAASLNENAKARANWEAYEGSTGGPSVSPDESLRYTIMSNELRSKILRFLTIKGVVIP